MNFIIKIERLAAQMQRALETLAGVLLPTIFAIFTLAILSSIMYADFLGYKIGVLLHQRTGMSVLAANITAMIFTGFAGFSILVLLHLTTIQTMLLVKQGEKHYKNVYINTAITVVIELGGVGSVMTTNNMNWGMLIFFIGMIGAASYTIIERTSLLTYVKRNDTANDFVNAELDKQHKAVSEKQMAVEQPDEIEIARERLSSSNGTARVGKQKEGIFKGNSFAPFDLNKFKN